MNICSSGYLTNFVFKEMQRLFDEVIVHTETSRVLLLVRTWVYIKLEAAASSLHKAGYQQTR